MTYVISLVDESVVPFHTAGLQVEDGMSYATSSLRKFENHVETFGIPKLVICDHGSFDGVAKAAGKNEKLSFLKQVPMIVFGGNPEHISTAEVNVIYVPNAAHQKPQDLLRIAIAFDTAQHLSGRNSVTPTIFQSSLENEPVLTTSDPRRKEIIRRMMIESLKI